MISPQAIEAMLETERARFAAANPRSAALAPSGPVKPHHLKPMVRAMKRLSISSVTPPILSEATIRPTS